MRTNDPPHDQPSKNVAAALLGQQRRVPQWRTATAEAMILGPPNPKLRAEISLCGNGQAGKAENPAEPPGTKLKGPSNRLATPANAVYDGCPCEADEVRTCT